jgi:hypothetical protein
MIAGMAAKKGKMMYATIPQIRLAVALPLVSCGLA